MEGLGGALYQMQDGKERDNCCLYDSPTLTAKERNYHLHSSKPLFVALKWSITERPWTVPETIYIMRRMLLCTRITTC